MHRILVIRSGALGDFILTLPAIRALREAAPEAHIELAGRPATLEIAHRRYYADAVVSIDRADFAPLFAPEGEPSSEIVAYLTGFDPILSYLPDRDGLFAMNLKCLGVRRLLSCDPVPPPDETRHIADRLAAPVERLGAPVRDPVPRLFPGEQDRRDADAFLHAHSVSDAFFVLHPGSGGTRKCWPPDRFARVADNIARQTGARIILSAGPADDQTIAQTVSVTKTSPVVAHDLPLPVLAALLSRCRACLGNDSGVTHLAAASGAPVVALFGPTDPRVWGPRGDRVRIIQGSPDLPPDRRLESIPTETVVHTLLEAGVWR